MKKDLNIAFKLGKDSFTIDFKKELTIDEDNLYDHLESAAANLAYYAVLKAKLTRHLNDLELHKQKMFGELFLITKEDDTLGRTPSDKHSESAAYENSDYIDLCEEVNEAREKVDMLWGLNKAYEYKIKLMQTMSADNRNS